MTIDKRETLSQLMDGEWQDLDANDSVQAICNDDELKSVWSRYHLIRDVLKNEPVQVQSSLSDRISAAIDDEPSYSNVASLGNRAAADPASTDAQSSTVAPASTDAPISEPTVAPKKTMRWQTGLSGLGLAACVAMVTVVGLNYWQTDAAPGQSVQTLTGIESTAAPADLTATQSFIPGTVLPRVELVSNTGTHWVSASSQRNAAVEQRLNMLLSEHIENSPTAERQGMLPYSRLVGYDTAPAE